MEAIVLAGGLGTRLRSVLEDIPKPMAPIGNNPFLQYIFDYLIANKVDKIILSVGYKYEVIKEYFGSEYKNTEIIYSIEDEPLGTGGAIKKAIELCHNDQIIIINGDTFFDVDLCELVNRHKEKKASLTLALKTMKQFDRYGNVEIDDSNKIISFQEKKYIEEGQINGGIYVINKNTFQKLNFPHKFSFEKEYMEKYFNEMVFCGFKYDGYFIDIGIPEDYEKSQEEIPKYFKEVGIKNEES